LTTESLTSRKPTLLSHDSQSRAVSTHQECQQTIDLWCSHCSGPSCSHRSSDPDVSSFDRSSNRGRVQRGCSSEFDPHSANCRSSDIEYHDKRSNNHWGVKSRHCHARHPIHKCQVSGGSIDEYDSGIIDCVYLVNSDSDPCRVTECRLLPFGNPYGMKPSGNVLLWQSSESGRRWTIEITNDVQTFLTPKTANTTLSMTFPRGASLGSCSRETIGSLIRLESFISFDGGITSVPNPATDQPRICDQYGTGVIGLWNSRTGSQLMRTFPGAPNENNVPTLLWVRIIGQYVYGSDMVTVDSSWVKVDLKNWGR